MKTPRIGKQQNDGHIYIQRLLGIRVLKQKRDAFRDWLSRFGSVVEQEIALAVKLEFLISIIVVEIIRGNEKHAMFDLGLIYYVEV